MEGCSVAFGYYFYETNIYTLFVVNDLKNINLKNGRNFYPVNKLLAQIRRLSPFKRRFDEAEFKRSGSLCDI